MAKVDWAPRVILRQTIVNRAPERWATAYAGYTDDKKAITEALSKLTPPIQADAVDRIIGNKSWTECLCDLCRTNSEVLLRVGSDPDYESRWLDICLPCVERLSSVAASIRSPA